MSHDNPLSLDSLREYTSTNFGVVCGVCLRGLSEEEIRNRLDIAFFGMLKEEAIQRILEHVRRAELEDQE